MSQVIELPLNEALALREAVRIAEALIFASREPVRVDDIALHVPSHTDVSQVMTELRRLYRGRGVQVVEVAGGYAMRTAEDLGHLMRRHAVEERRLSRAAQETLAIIAYHQPVTRAEIEEVRGVACSKGTLDVLLEAGWVRLRGRRQSPGRPVTYGTTDGFLDHFGLGSVDDLPGVEELKGTGLLDAAPPRGIPDEEDALGA